MLRRSLSKASFNVICSGVQALGGMRVPWERSLRTYQLAPAAMEEQTPSATPDAMTNDAASNLVGPGCAAYADAVPSGAGSIQGMSQDPVAVAASNNPLLTTLTAAVSGGLNPDVNLVDTLNGGEFTVFAPVDDAQK